MKKFLSEYAYTIIFLIILILIALLVGYVAPQKPIESSESPIYIY